MSRMRDHKVFKITCSYHQRIAESDGGGEVVTTGLTTDRYTETLLVIGPDVDTIHGWCINHFRYYTSSKQKFRIDSIESLGPVRGFIQEHVW